MTSKRSRYTPHQRIMRAHRSGRGVTLNQEEVDHLAHDDAIATAARLDDMRDKARAAANRHGARNGHETEVLTDSLGYAYAICHICEWEHGK
jgi:hypothetical protein